MIDKGNCYLPGLMLINEDEEYASIILENTLSHFKINKKEVIVRELKKRIGTLINKETSDNSTVSYLALYEKDKGKDIRHAFLGRNAECVLLSDRNNLLGEEFKKRIIRIYSKDKPYEEAISPEIMKNQRSEEELKAYYEFKTDCRDIIGITDNAKIEHLNLADGRVFCISQGFLTRSTEEMQLIQRLLDHVKHLSARISEAESNIKALLNRLS